MRAKSSENEHPRAIKATKRSKPAPDDEEEENEDEEKPAKKRAKKMVPVASRNDEDGGDEDEAEDKPAKKRAKKMVPVASRNDEDGGDDGENEEKQTQDDKEKKELDLFYAQIRDELRTGKISLMDTKMRAMWFLPPNSEIARSAEIWDRMLASQSESKVVFASCLARSVVVIEPPMILRGSQPAKLMTGGIFLSDEEYKAKRASSSSAPPGLFSGTPETLARLAIAAPETTTKTKMKKNAFSNEWWYQLSDKNGKLFATTQAVISVLLEQGRIVSRPDGKLEIVSPTGFVSAAREATIPQPI